MFDYAVQPGETKLVGAFNILPRRSG